MLAACGKFGCKAEKESVYFKHKILPGKKKRNQTQSMRIQQVDSSSIAAELKLQPGDDLITINGQPIRDEIDFRFHVSEEKVELRVRRDSSELVFQVEKEPDDLLGIHPEVFCTRACGNRCIFCFTDQNPPGLRPALYFKDEDYRLSFLYGHYTTLTNTSQHDLERIVRQRLSPLYVSVHAVDWAVRKSLLGLKRPDNLLAKIRFLVENRIQLHTQIVVCPDFNDGEQLRKTILVLAEFYPGVQSVAVVPVGLTRHRQQLPHLHPVTAEIAVQVLDQLSALQQRFRTDLATAFAFASDEFFLQSGCEIPAADFYEDYPQIEDGVGIIRFLLESFQETASELPTALSSPQHIFLISGTSATPIIDKEIVPVLNRIRGCHVTVVPVVNRFYGDSVTVTGLLTGQDIAYALQENSIRGTVLISTKCLNHDGLFLDDWDVERLANATGCKVLLVDDYLRDLPEMLRKKMV